MKKLQGKPTEGQLADLIKGLSPSDPVGFHKVVVTVLERGLLTESEFYKKFSVNRATFLQWKEGTLAPSVGFRKSIYSSLLKELEPPNHSK